MDMKKIAAQICEQVIFPEMDAWAAKTKMLFDFDEKLVAVIKAEIRKRLAAVTLSMSGNDIVVGAIKDPGAD